MINDFISALGNVPFFNTAAFGIIALVLVGASWCLVGAIAGKVPKLGYSMETLYLTGSSIAMIFIAIVCGATTGIGKCAITPLLLTSGAFFLGGVGCFFQGVAMSRAMQCGPNGIIWAIIQSAMIFPFIFGVAFYDVKLNILRILGICLMIGALVMFAFAKDNSKKTSGSWQVWTFAALIVVGIEQVVTNIPFYYQETKNISSMFNIFCMMFGYLVSSIVVMLFNKNCFTELKTVICKKSFWIYSVSLLPLAALIAIILQLPGMRAMADNGLGAMSFPILVGSCIAAFTLYSAIILKEKFKIIDLIALISCIGGQILLCM